MYYRRQFSIPESAKCGQQLDTAMRLIALMIMGGNYYISSSGRRNIGIINKLKAYALQEKGMDTVEANLKLGLPADDRDFSIAIEILNLLGVKTINLITNNPVKIKTVEESNIKLVDRIPLQMEATQESKDYLKKANEIGSIPSGAKVIVGFHKDNSTAYKPYKISAVNKAVLYKLSGNTKVILDVFGSPYALMDVDIQNIPARTGFIREQ
ncbi:hypothetical protein FQR65_LT20511 [Abscondita terminalis]|nr:hypothetical protein FQR65_LT20511 [Abscondita terminalis]